MPSTRRTVETMRAEAREHARQIEAVVWLSVQELAERWRVSTGTVRKIARADLPYLTLGETNVRRYDPRDVEAYEQRAKQGQEPAA